MRKSYLQVGKIVGTHGVRGECKLDPWTDSQEVFDGLTTLYLDPEGKQPVRVLRTRPHKRQELLMLEDVKDLDAAEKLRGTVLYAAREDLPLKEGAYFIAEILGCEVRDADDPDRIYGKVTDVTNHGAGDIWSVRKDGKTVLMPILPGLLVDVDLDAERILVRPIPGIFNDPVEVRGE
ncbi:MAG: ribosome maturation factor RimM [Acutalibacteraceae bacterium]